MAINAAPDAFFSAGGDTISGPEADDYHCIVSDASRGMSADGTKAQLILEFTVKDDKNHPAMEGKKLSKAWFTWPAAADSETDKKKALGRLKRMLYEGLGVPWPKEAKPVDPRSFSTKEAFVRIGTTTNKKTGKSFTGVTHIVQDPKKFPAKVATDKNGAVAGSQTATTPSRRRGAAQASA
ncbi:MAG: hypothetical protein EPN91_08275 [Salinibacterium sp.]|nr:MAG: hypothetical protein EPN91_08275 [Salinibacterium sp.]